MKDLTPEQKEAFKKEIIAISWDAYSRMEDGKNDLKHAVNNINAIYGIGTKMSRKLVKTYYDESLDEQKEEFKEFEEFCSEIFE